MKPETEIRNLKREMKDSRLARDRSLAASNAQTKALGQRVRELEAENAALTKDNGRLEEIAALCRRLAEGL